MRGEDEMRQYRYIICLLLAGAMLYYAVPRLDIYSGGAEGIFTLSWLAFALIVIAGNLTALLYSPKSSVNVRARRKVTTTNRKRMRSY